MYVRASRWETKSDGLAVPCKMRVSPFSISGRDASMRGTDESGAAVDCAKEEDPHVTPG